MKETKEKFEEHNSKEVNVLVQTVLRETYLEQMEDLRYYAEKIRMLNKQKKEIRMYLTELRNFCSAMRKAVRQKGINLCKPDERDMAVISKLFTENTRAYERSQVRLEFCIPEFVPPQGVTSFSELETEIRNFETELSAFGDDATLVYIDLQNAMQRGQQTVQMMSNISKILHDTAMATIRKIG
jgi:hypothetical protein